MNVGQIGAAIKEVNEPAPPPGVKINRFNLGVEQSKHTSSLISFVQSVSELPLKNLNSPIF